MTKFWHKQFVQFILRHGVQGIYCPSSEYKDIRWMSLRWNQEPPILNSSFTFSCLSLTKTFDWYPAQLCPSLKLFLDCGVNLVWNLGVVDPGQKILIFSKGFFLDFRFFRQLHKKVWFFQADFRKFRFFSGNFTRNFYFPGKNWPFTATSGQIVLFLFKSHHFRTYMYRPTS